MWVLRFHCEAHGLSVPVTKNFLSVGRDPTNDVILPVPGISRRHCEFMLAGEQGRELYVRDCDSRLGVSREGKRLDHDRLEEGDRLTLGSVWIFVQKESTLDWRTPGGLSPSLPARMHTGESPDAASFSSKAGSAGILNACIRAYTESRDWGNRWRRILGLSDLEIIQRGDGKERCVLPGLWRTAPEQAESIDLEGVRGTWTCRWTGGGEETESVLPTLLNILEAVQVRVGATRQIGAEPQGGRNPKPPSLVGLDGPWEEVERLVASDLPILITGETGVGKEVLARAIHQLSMGQQAPFQVIHCAAIPEALFESELFGIQPNTATGVLGRRGKLETANEGTVLLDEVGEIPLHIQAKLLRVLEDSKIYPLGSRAAVPLKVRWLSATNQNLEKAIRRGEFREDLYYRLRGAEVRIPPLRERRRWIPPLVDLFLEENEASSARDVQGLSLEAFRAVTEYGWPGNVRELKMELKRAYHLADSGGIIQTRHLSPQVRAWLAETKNAPGVRMEVRRRAAEATAIREALASTGGNVTRAADLLGVTRQTLSKYLRTLGIRARDFKRT